MTQYEPVIGLECHAQLRTSSKLFCSCSTRFGDLPNMNTCPVCLGLPGALPALNRVAVAMAIRAALALNCKVNAESQWSRKNYFYPDLPKGYQISQYDRPLARNGFLGRVGVERIHMEEDAGKSIHDGFPDSNRYTYLDFNRSGVPLIEIVSRPDLRSSQEAHDYLMRLKEILEYLDVCDGNMEEGSLRCDANVSIRPVGDTSFGTRTELKNINSFRFLQKAIDFEVERQIGIVESGGRVAQETRLWNSVEDRTVSMRSKEEAHDYRYFPDPDLPLLRIEDDLIKNIRQTMPELPERRRMRFLQQYGLTGYEAGILTATRSLANFFEDAARLSGQPKAIANWVMGDLLRLYKESGTDLHRLDETPFKPSMLADVVRFIDSGTISGKIGKTIVEEMFRTGKQATTIIEEKGLIQISDSAEIEHVIGDVTSENADIVQQYQSGKTGVFGFLVGQIMKRTGGRANPRIVNELLRKKLAGRN